MSRKPLVKAHAELTAEQVKGMSLSAIARFVHKDWPRPYFGCVPYMEAMLSLERVTDTFGADTGQYVVRGFLSNCATYRGASARVVKAELNARLRVRAAG
jgi:hypothetical protein